MNGGGQRRNTYGNGGWPGFRLKGVVLRALSTQTFDRSRFVLTSAVSADVEPSDRLENFLLPSVVHVLAESRIWVSTRRETEDVKEQSNEGAGLVEHGRRDVQVDKHSPDPGTNRSR